jgi:hypothetical protein
MSLPFSWYYHRKFPRAKRICITHESAQFPTVCERVKPLLPLVLTVCALLFWAQDPPSTLRRLLADDGMKVTTGTLPNLDKPITSGSSLNDPARYVAAYYLDDGTNALNGPMFIDKYDQKAGTWKSAALNGNNFSINVMGSVQDIQASAESLFVDTHISPSGGCLLILSQDLKPRGALFGWYLARFRDDSLVYQRGEVHFAAVHPTELALYNWRTKRDTALFPRKPFQAIRLAHIQELREFFSTRREWCKKNNDPCNPEEMDSTLVGDIAINDLEHALAFLISYEQIQITEGDQKPSWPGKVVYVIRNVNDPAKIDFREMLLSDIEARFGKVSLSNLLEPNRLAEVFRKSPS